MAEDGEKKGSTFNVEYDKSGRAACKEKDCKMKITKGSVRIGKAFEAFERLQHHYFHPECLIRKMMPRARAWRFEKVEEIDGHDALTPEDRAWVQGLIDEVTEDRIKEDERPRGAPEGEMPAGTGSKKPAAAAAADEDAAVTTTSSGRKRKPSKKAAEADELDDDEVAEELGGDDDDEEDGKKRKRKPAKKARKAAKDDEEDGEGHGDGMGDEDYGGGGASSSSAAAGAGKPAAKPRVKKADKPIVGPLLSAEPPSTVDGLVVVFTGVRDEEAKTALEARGGRMAATFSGKVQAVITKDAESVTTEKINAAAAKGVKIYTIAQMRTALGLPTAAE